jgi:hypothetical protein
MPPGENPKIYLKLKLLTKKPMKSYPYYYTGRHGEF